MLVITTTHLPEIDQTTGPQIGWKIHQYELETAAVAVTSNLAKLHNDETRIIVASSDMYIMMKLLKNFNVCWPLGKPILSTLVPGI